MQIRIFKSIGLTAVVSIACSTGHVFAGPVNANYATGAEVPITAEAFTATGKTVDINLNFPPKPGTKLTIVRNTGPAMIHGTFANLPSGQTVSLNYAGLTFKFVVNYHGGAGNDLVLEWTTDGNLSAVALTKLDSQLVLALKEARKIAPFDKSTSIRPNIPVRDGERVLVNIDGSISKDLIAAIGAGGGQVVNDFVNNTSARAMVPVSQLENLAARSDVNSVSTSRPSVTSKFGP